jgi:EPS-associated MarR family transcriptional regulator
MRQDQAAALMLAKPDCRNAATMIAGCGSLPPGPGMDSTFIPSTPPRRCHCPLRQVMTEERPDPTQLALMRLLSTQPQLTQRELARRLGLSLGKKQYLLHALLDRGLVGVGNFRRNGNKLAYAYLLTPAGLGAKLALTRHFLARKVAEFVQLQATIAALRAEVPLQPSSRRKSWRLSQC